LRVRIALFNMEKYSFNTVLEQFQDNLWFIYILVPEEIMEHYKGTDRRVVCQIGDLKPFHCALMPKGDGRYFININNNTSVSFFDFEVLIIK